MSGKTSRRKFIQTAGAAATGLITTAPVTGAGVEPQGRPTGRTSMPARFRALLQGPDVVQCVGVHDVLSARLVEINGFPSVFVGGSTGSSNGHALPDIGLVSTVELIEYVKPIAQSIDIPVFADADDCGGTALDIYRYAKEFERAGVAAVMYEDRLRQERLKGNVRLSPVNEVIDRIHAAKDASPDLLVVLRSEALSAKIPMEETLARGVKYAEAGADVLFFAGMKIEDFPRAADAVKAPLYGPFHIPMAQLKAARVKLVVYTSILRDIAAGAVNSALLELKSTEMLANAEKGAIPGSMLGRLTRAQDISDQIRRYNFR
jgi:2-methylisocitrate lyase-like PEP mutase family enzyme